MPQQGASERIGSALHQQTLAVRYLSEMPDSWPVRALPPGGFDACKGFVEHLQDDSARLLHDNTDSAGLPELLRLDVSPGLRLPWLEVQEALSSGTTSQGKVYSCVLMNPSPSPADGAAVVSSDPFFQPIGMAKPCDSTPVLAALKKSLIPRPGDWEVFLCCQFGSFNQDLRERIYLPEDRDLPEQQLKLRLRHRIVYRWTSVNTEPIVDAVASACLSEFVRKKGSPFHPLLYGSFSAWDTAWYQKSPLQTGAGAIPHNIAPLPAPQAPSGSIGHFAQAVGASSMGHHQLSRHPPAAQQASASNPRLEGQRASAQRNATTGAMGDAGPLHPAKPPSRTDQVIEHIVMFHPPPVLLMFMERLDGTLRSVCRETGIFGQKEKFRWDILRAFLGQIVWGLALAQEHCELVNNDAHWNNIMFRKVPKDSFLYYQHRDSVYRFPTFGYVLVLIDYGRASLRAHGHRFCKNEYITRSSLDTPRLDNDSADLVRTALECTRLLRANKAYDVRQEREQSAGHSRAAAGLPIANPIANKVFELVKRWRTVQEHDEHNRVVRIIDLEDHRRDLYQKYKTASTGASTENFAVRAQNEAYVWAPVDSRLRWYWDAKPCQSIEHFREFYYGPASKLDMRGHDVYKLGAVASASLGR